MEQTLTADSTTPTRVVRETPIADWLEAAARRDGDQVYIRDVGLSVELTFAQVAQRVRQLAHALVDAGVRKGDRIALWGLDSHRYLETLWACTKIGALFVPLNPRLTAFEVEGFLTQTQPRALFYSGASHPQAVEVAARVPAIEHLFDLDSTDSFESFLASGSTAELRLPVLDADPIGLAFTSGTTGAAKQVIQSQRMMKWLVSACVASGWEVGIGESMCTGISLFHISGMAISFTGAYLGNTTTLNPSFDPDVVVDLLEQGKLTALLLVPSMVAMVVDRAQGRGPFTSLRSIHYGAAPMPAPVLHRAVDLFGCDFIQTFGAGTESGGTTFLSSRDHRRALAGEEHLLKSVGKPGPGVEVRICDDQWRDVPLGEVGEVVVRCDQIMNGYVDNPEASAQALHPDGWFRAGDLGYRDAEGFLYLVDRRSNMIIRGGENIYPVEIEQALYTLGGIVECAVVGAPHELLGEVPVAHLVLEDPTEPPTPEELRTALSERLADYKVPRTFVFHDELPKNATGKIVKRQLREDA